MPEITIVRRSIDARKKPQLFFNYIVNVQVKTSGFFHTYPLSAYLTFHQKKSRRICDDVIYQFPVAHYSGQVRPIIIGAGPAGLFVCPAGSFN